MATPLTDFMLKVAGVSLAAGLLVGVPVGLGIMAYRSGKQLRGRQYEISLLRKHAALMSDDAYEAGEKIKILTKELARCQAGHAPTAEYSVLPTDEVPKFRR